MSKWERNFRDAIRNWSPMTASGATAGPAATALAPKRARRPKAKKGGQVPAPPKPASAPFVRGVQVLRQGAGPRVFLVEAHPPEAEELVGPQEVARGRQDLAAALAPCSVCALLFDEEAYKCKTSSELVNLYTRRVNAHRQIFRDQLEGEPLAVVGWSFTCPLATALAASLEKAGVEDVRLILLGDNSLLLPAVSRHPEEDASPDRDAWLGGRIEAVLLCARAVGAGTWAAEEARALRGRGFKKPEEFEDVVEDLQMRLFWEEGAKPGHLQRLGPLRFAELSNTTGTKAEAFRTLSMKARGPPGYEDLAWDAGFCWEAGHGAKWSMSQQATAQNFPDVLGRPCEGDFYADQLGHLKHLRFSGVIGLQSVESLGYKMKPDESDEGFRALAVEKKQLGRSLDLDILSRSQSVGPCVRPDPLKDWAPAESAADQLGQNSEPRVSTKASSLLSPPAVPIPLALASRCQYHHNDGTAHFQETQGSPYGRNWSEQTDQVRTQCMRCRRLFASCTTGDTDRINAIPLPFILDSCPQHR
ncbi:unnamed protein product [Symbiodinium sp. CCMP2456]|nr:unnamed protein product [Symbiodinium sp. CCMP2456]